ncbi:Alpha/Beta hydrolase protein [Ilyonectria sp. MPI-CAGE-AT-0026]|nr:Alpha/Beta hydrolase protein [Ilyonectria sp. MPI-CAGE-AT-0026]
MSDFSAYGGPSDEWLAVQATLPPQPATDQPLSELKHVINKGRETMAAEAMKSLASQVHIKDFKIPTRDGSSIEARTYRPVSIHQAELLPVYIHLHGGGFLFGSLASEDAICARIACGAEVVVLNVDYRHTPEHIYPTAWNDTEDAFEWAHANMREFGGDGQKLVIGGISAGAQLAASLTLEQHLKTTSEGPGSLPVIAGQVLMIPCLTHDECYEPQLKRLTSPSVWSYKENEDAPILPVKVARYFIDLLQIKDPQVDDTRLNPGNATPAQVEGLPPTVFGMAGLDPLRDEGLLYAKLLTEARVPTDVNLFQGVPHGFRRFGDSLSASARWDKVMEDGIRWALSKPSPADDFVIKT